MARIKVQTGCRDCTMCTGNAFTGKGRSMGRGTADVLTLGVTAVARKKCKACGHPMSEHRGSMQNVPGHGAGAASTNPARWIKADDGRYRWWNGDNWTDYYVATSTPDAAQIDAAKAAVVDFPPRWRQQPDGRFQWWAGNLWTTSYTRDPGGEIEYAQAEAAVTSTASAADEIQKLAELHKSGILTDDEFAAAKKKALGI
jgi:hypothetical protein